jgi:hypothetical protein
MTTHSDLWEGQNKTQKAVKIDGFCFSEKHHYLPLSIFKTE